MERTGLGLYAVMAFGIIGAEPPRYIIRVFIGS
jgi:hypothetical protein